MSQHPRNPVRPTAPLPSWPMYHRVWRRAELLDRMIDVLALDPLKAVSLDGGQAYFDARTRCLACFRAPECREMIELEPRRAGPPAFCLNEAYFSRCPPRADIVFERGEDFSPAATPAPR